MKKQARSASDGKSAIAAVPGEYVLECVY